MNASDVIQRSLNDAQQKGLQGRDSGFRNPLTQGNFKETLHREERWVEETEVISLDFSDGVWQKTGSPGYDRFTIFSHVSRTGNREKLREGLENDKVYYNKKGMLVIKEELKGRFVDGIF
ncbi:MAG: hypothetical protein SVY10_00990 [Thermodesulfobacteriota bacterium]|nr:hypothetical protein [Thermodesulfobacteriota bacterium]